MNLLMATTQVIDLVRLVLLAIRSYLLNKTASATQSSLSDAVEFQNKQCTTNR